MYPPKWCPECETLRAEVRRLQARLAESEWFLSPGPIANAAQAKQAGRGCDSRGKADPAHGCEEIVAPEGHYEGSFGAGWDATGSPVEGGG